MEHDSASAQVVSMSPEMSALIEETMKASLQDPEEQKPVPTRGRPARLSQRHLAWAVVWCLMMGYHAQLEIWRVLRLGFGCLMPLVLSNQAVYKRLSQGGMQAMQSLLVQVSGVQILASLLLANVFHAAQRQIAQQAGVEVFEVSMDLLVRYVPRLLQRGLDPIETLVRCGRALGVIRPSTRRRMQVPDIGWHQILWPPSDLVIERAPRYAHSPDGRARSKKKSAS